MILITGASGYLGSHISKCLVSSGKTVRGLVHNFRIAESEARLNNLKIEWLEGDVTKPDTLITAMQGVTAVIHTVAIAIEKGNQTYEKINYLGTVNVINAAKDAGVRRFINISQLGAAPDLPYQLLASKGKAQKYVTSSGMDWTAFRPSVIWGPEDEFANTFARLVAMTPLIFPLIGDESSRFQPVWVDDVAGCVLKTLDDPNTIGKEYELGGPEVLTMEEIERRTLRAVHARRLLIHFPMSLLRIAVTLMEKLLPNPPVTQSLLDLLSVSNVPASNAINQFIPHPRPFTTDNISPYMQLFNIRDTLKTYFKK